MFVLGKNVEYCFYLVKIKIFCSLSL